MTLAVRGYKTKKELKAAIGQPLRHKETSLFGPEYRNNGVVFVVGPCEHTRKWFAKVTMENGLIKGVS
jgi:hypothetical protein